MDIRVGNLKKPVNVSEYLFKRLHQIGVRSVHGLPGDYNLVALDYIPGAGLKWVGNCNELNAAYAADGYARVNGIAAIVTTFGVGELSAINGLAGAYSEMVPVVHIVGTPSTASQRDGMLLHHTLGNGDFNVFANMSAPISCVVAKLADPAEIPSQIDHALQQCWLKSRPVYITLPTDMATAKVEGQLLDTPIDLADPENKDKEREDYVVDVILKYLHGASAPVILIDACAVRHRVLEEVHQLLEKTKLPTFVTPMGKSAVNEEHESYGGVYAGDASKAEVKKMVEESDLVLSIGSLQSDFNTAGFSFRLSQLKTIELHSNNCKVRYSEYPGVSMKGVLRKVIEKVDVSKLKVNKVPAQASTPPTAEDGDKDIIKQDAFWPRIGRFLKKDDIVVTETGTANFGIWDTKFPSGVTALNQTLWGSIGWAVGACQGAALGTKDAGTKRRTVLFEGDGSLQLTVQEISTMIRHNLDVIIFLICNDGYTIERFIHGMDAEYNDVVNWNYKSLVDVFTPSTSKTTPKKYVVKTPSELETLLADDSFATGGGVRFVELYMPRDDAPTSLKMTAEASAKRNAE